jgi:EmrB/QacA subfamily drug resistance transporter
MPESMNRRRRTLVLAVCCMSLLLAGLDVTAVNVALPAIHASLNAPISGLQWTVDGYTLAVAVFLILSGSTADRFGRRRVFQAGLAVFTLSSLACSLAPGLAWLVGFRAMQGVGASMLNPVALSILTNTFTEPKERARAIGIWGGMFGLSLALGPVLGGLLVAVAGWRSVFWINLPFGAAAIVLSRLLIPESRAERARRVDPIGQVLVVVALVSTVYGIIEGLRHGFGALTLGAVAFAALAAYETRRDQPLIDPAFFRSVPFTGSVIAAIAGFVAFSGYLFLNTLYLQDARGYSPLHAGVATVPMALATAVGSPISGRMTAAFGPRRPLVAAGCLVAAAAVLLTRVTSATDPVLPVVVGVVFGAGFGLVNAPITNNAVSGMPRSQAGVSAAISSTGRQVGNSLGVAVLGSIVSAHGTEPGAGTGFTSASHIGWWVVVGCGLVIASLGALTTTRRAVATAERVGARFGAEDLPKPVRTVEERRPVVA